MVAIGYDPPKKGHPSSGGGGLSAKKHNKKWNEGTPEKDQQPAGGGDLSANTKKKITLGTYAPTVTHEHRKKERKTELTK